MNSAGGNNCATEQRINSDLEEVEFDVVLYEVVTLAPLAAVKVIAGNVQRNLGTPESVLKTFLLR